MEPGDVVAERFEIEHLAGVGGMGSVYRAKDRLDGTNVALKVMLRSNEHEVARFDRECAVLADLLHPGIVRYIAHGLSGDSTPFLAMEWLDGHDVATLLARRALMPDDAIRLVIAVADALSFAHARGVVHRDVKPSNVFLVGGRTDRVKVLDFGVARVGAGQIGITRTGLVLGTPAYMAPEQARGARSVDARADVFSLGALLFECLTGRTPFDAETVVAVLAKILLEEPPHVREFWAGVPPALDELVARMLSKTPAERPENADEVASALRALDPCSVAIGITPEAVAAPSGVLTGAEQRVRSVVILRGVIAPRLVEPGATANHDDHSAQPPRVPTALGPTLELPDTVRLDALREPVKAYGGRLEALADGSVVVMLHSRGTAADQATHAARCALALHAVVPDAPIALATGAVEVGGRRRVGALIDAAAAALAVEDPTAAPRGGARIRVDELSAALLDRRFRITEGGGSTRWLVAELTSSDVSRTLLGKATPCVGRERELGALDATLTECIDEGVARAVLVVAPAGVGKSRLRQEFLRRVGLREEPPSVWIAQGDPMRAGSPFGMLGQLVRAVTGVRESDPLERRQSQLRAHVAKLAPELDADAVTEFLGEIIAVPFPDGGSPRLRAARCDARVMSDQTRDAWLKFVSAECARRPVLLVLEDLHWGDLPTVKLVDAALRDLSERSLMVLALARTDIDTAFPKIWAGRGVQDIRLGELSRKAAEKLVRQLLGPDVGAETIERLVSHAEGNAFYLEELIRAEAEGKSDTLPESVLAMVQARLDALAPDQRRMLRAASVFGQAFWSGAVAALLGQERSSEVPELLDTLVEGELLVRRPEPRFRGESEYAFRHALVRESAYATLTNADRSVGHRGAGEWLETAGETDPLVLAEHLERGEEPERAAQLYRFAAEQALAGHDIEGALARVERAVALGAAGETLGALLTIRTEALMWDGHYRESQARAVEAIGALEPGSAPWYKSVGLALWLSRNVNDVERLVDTVEILRQRGDADPPSGAQAMAWALAIWALVSVRKPEIAQLVARWLERLRARLPAVDLVSQGWVAQGLFFLRFDEGDIEGALDLGRSATDLFERAGDHRNALLARAHIGRPLMALGDYAHVERWMRECLDESERVNLPVLGSAARRFLAASIARQGRAQEARQIANEAARLFDGESPALSAIWRVDCAVSMLMGGDVEGAEQQLDAAAAAASEAGAVRALWQTALARVRLNQERVDEASALVREAMGSYAKLGRFGDHEVFVRLVFAESLLRSAADPEETNDAARALRERVLAMAERIVTPTLRESFLHRVAEHAQALALAEEILRT